MAVAAVKVWVAVPGATLAIGADDFSVVSCARNGSTDGETAWLSSAFYSIHPEPTILRVSLSHSLH